MEDLRRVKSTYFPWLMDERNLGASAANLTNHNTSLLEFGGAGNIMLAGFNSGQSPSHSHLLTKQTNQHDRYCYRCILIAHNVYRSTWQFKAQLMYLLCRTAHYRKALWESIVLTAEPTTFITIDHLASRGSTLVSVRNS